MAEGGKAKSQNAQQHMSVPVINPVILQNRRGDIVKDILPDCVGSVIAGVKPLLNYSEVDSIDAADKRTTKVSTLIHYLQCRVHGGSYGAFNAFVKIIAGVQPELFTSLAGRPPTQAETDCCVENYVEVIKGCIESQGHSTDSELDQKIDLDVQHIQLTLVKDETGLDSSQSLPHDYQSYAEDIQTRGESISAIDLLGTEEEQDKPQKVSLYGWAGIGKSTTTQWLARQWATAGWGSGFTMLFLLQLRMLAVSDCQVTTIELLSMFGLFQVSDPDLVSLMASWLRNSVTKVIIFIDGLDEVAGFTKRLKNCRKITDLNQKAHPIELCLNILRGVLLPGCTVVSTSRPFTGLSELKSDKQFEIMGFTEADVERFVQRRHPSKAEEVMSVLRKSPILTSVCGIAFYCSLVSSLLADGVVFREDELQTYTRLIAFITIQYVSRKLSDCSFLIEVKSYFPKLASLAHEGIFGNQMKGELSKVVFEEYDLSNAKLTSQEFQSAQDVGILQTKRVKTGLRHSIIAEFFHLSVQEMLAVAYLLAYPSNSENLFMDLFSGGQFSIALIYLFGLQYDTRSHWIKDIRFSVNPSEYVSNVTVDTQISDLLECLCQQCGHTFRNRLQICQLLYEGCMEHKIKDVTRYIAPNRKFNISITTITIIDLMAILFVCKHVESLTEIDINCCHFTDSMCSFMVSTFLMDHADTLTTLRLGHNKIGQSGAKAIAEWLKQNHTLQVLDIESNDIGKAGAIALADMLYHNSNLRVLRLPDNIIGVNGAIALGAALHKNCSLRLLNVCQNNIGNDGVKSLAAALHINSTLTSLYLNYNNIGEEGASALAEALHDNNTLQIVYIGHNCIGDKGAKYFALALNHNKTLHTLSVNNNNIGTAGTLALTSAHHANDTLHTLYLFKNKSGLC